MDRDQHLPAGSGAPVHLTGQVYGCLVPAVFLARAGRTASARGSVGCRVRRVPGTSGCGFLLVAASRLTTSGLAPCRPPGPATPLSDLPPPSEHHEARPAGA